MAAPAAAASPAPRRWQDVVDEQDGVLSRRQALTSGLSEDGWQWRLDRGWWQAVLPGVVVCHSGEPTHRQRAWAAVLYAGQGAALSADAALVELGMRLKESMPLLKRRALVRVVLDDVELGAHALSELDFLRLLRRNRLPLPDALQLRPRTAKVCYLDAVWKRQRVAAEIDGVHHVEIGAWDADVLRANAVVIGHRDDRLLLLRFTTGNCRHDEPVVVQQLRAVLL